MKISVAFRFTQESVDLLKKVSAFHKRSSTSTLERLLEEEEKRISISENNSNIDENKNVPIFIKDKNGDDKVIGHLDTDRVGFVFK